MTKSRQVADFGAGGFYAGKNKIINGDFNINQRAFSSTTSSGIYGFDRWLSSFGGDGTSTMSAQTFTAGAAPVAGYEAINFVRLESTGQTTSATRTVVQQRMEDVRTFANQTVTVSFWAKAASGTPSVAANFLQSFGSGGSTAVSVNGQKTAITTSWARYSLTFNIPSISGKTLGAGSYLMLRIWTSCGSDEATSSDSLGIQTATIDIWGVQAETGSVATPFQTATGTLAGELAACQRYCYKTQLKESSGIIGHGFTSSTTNAIHIVKLAQTMRTNPSMTASGTFATEAIAAYPSTTVALAANTAATDAVRINHTISGATANLPALFCGSNDANAYLLFTAEL